MVADFILFSAESAIAQQVNPLLPLQWGAPAREGFPGIRQGLGGVLPGAILHHSQHPVRIDRGAIVKTLR
jgi:hypothetical protein